MANPGDGRPAATIASAIQTYALRHGLIVERGGREDAVIRLLPPLSVTAEVVDMACATPDISSRRMRRVTMSSSWCPPWATPPKPRSSTPDRSGYAGPLLGARSVLVAGFQVLSRETEEITALGRGGSDTMAIALAAALKADVPRCGGP